MESKLIALDAAKALDSKRGSNILIIDVAEKSSFADYLVLASGSSLRQVASLADEAEDKLAEDGVELKNSEGYGNTGWILLDFGDVIVNVFTEEMREKYNLEKVWADCEAVPYESDVKEEI